MMITVHVVIFGPTDRILSRLVKVRVQRIWTVQLFVRPKLRVGQPLTFYLIWWILYSFRGLRKFQLAGQIWMMKSHFSPLSLFVKIDLWHLRNLDENIWLILFLNKIWINNDCSASFYFAKSKCNQTVKIYIKKKA